MRNKVPIFYDDAREAVFIGTVRNAFPPRTLNVRLTNNLIEVMVAYSDIAIFSDVYSNILGRDSTGKLMPFASAAECLAYLRAEFEKRRAVSCECVQSEPSAHWIFNHCLGFRPSVTVVDTAGTQIIGAVTWPDVDTIEIDFEGTPVAGTVYLS